MKIKNITIGTDPELFLKKNNEIISAEGLIGGTKDNPKMISKKGHAVQEDNIMVEFNIPPAKSSVSFIKDINFVLDYLTKVAYINDASLCITPSEIVNPKYLKTKQARTFGCEPDYNVYLKDANPSPKTNSKLRTCGGHIHIGYDDPNRTITEKIIKTMDLFLGVPSVILDTDVRRKTMYGKAGAFRFKNFGCEYRTLSNFWIKNDELKKWAFDSVKKGIEFINNDDNYTKLLRYENNIIKCINNNDIKLAEKIMNEFKEVTLINNKILEKI